VALAVVEGAGSGAYVRCLATIDLLRVFERCAALPEFDDEGVAGLSHGAGAPVAGDEQGVFVDPSHVLFGVREDKAAFNEFAGPEVEFSQCFGVFAARRKAYEAEAITWIEAVETLVDPLLVVLFGKGVVVNNGVPVGVVGEIAFEGGAAEDAANVICVLPGVVDGADAKLGGRQASGRLKDFESSIGKGVIDGADVEGFGGAIIFGVYPGHGAFAVNVFKPLIFIGLFRGVLCEASQRRGEEQGEHDGCVAASKQHLSSLQFGCAKVASLAQLQVV
jgi:hypothetical protein